jgi:hypothetical protein
MAYTFEEIAEHMKALGVEDFIVVGIDKGGTPHFASSHGEREPICKLLAFAQRHAQCVPNTFDVKQAPAVSERQPTPGVHEGMLLNDTPHPGEQAVTSAARYRLSTSAFAVMPDGSHLIYYNGAWAFIRDFGTVEQHVRTHY